MNPPAWKMRREFLGGVAPWRHIQSAWSLDEGAARLAWMRGTDDPQDLAWRMQPNWESTFEPYGMDGMGKAVARINEAIAKKEKITIYGDYDVDGVTATALLIRVLERMGGDVAFFIPNRFNDGYGLHLECIRELAQARKPKLLISVDCGVRSAKEVAASAEMGMEWIITDHHSPGDDLPQAVATIHPHFGSQPNRHLAGVGVAFKLAQALLDAVPVPKGGVAAFLDGLLKLVAIGTIADMVPLLNENALLVKRGLAALNGQNAPGLAALLKSANCEGHVTSSAIAFGMAPRLNAVGRMGGAEDAVKLLLSRDAKEAQAIMTRIEILNTERRSCQRELAKVLPSVEEVADTFDLVVEPSAHKGVIGIVAGQRMRDCGRPSGVCTVVDGVAHCSLRAPEPFDLTEMLVLAGPFLKSGGGHRAAAGITFDLKHLAFVKGILTKAAKAQYSKGGAPFYDVDGEGVDWVPDMKNLSHLEPFGRGWPDASAIVQGQLDGTPELFGDLHWKLRLKGMPQPIKWFFAKEKYPQGPPKTGETLCLALSPHDHPRLGRSWRVDSLLDSGTAL